MTKRADRAVTVDTLGGSLLIGVSLFAIRSRFIET